MSITNQKLGFVAVPALVAVALGVFAFWPSDGRPQAGSTLRVLFTGETLGQLEPCHCGGFMSGGLPRRSGYVKTVDEPFLLLDVGCVGAGTRDFERLRGQAAWRGMRVMGTDAVNIGETELWLGREKLRERASPPPLISLNVTDEAGKPVVPRFMIQRVGGLDVVVTGLVTDEVEPGPGLRVEPPVEALARNLADLREAAEIIVLLADLQEAQVRELARRFPELTLILFRARGNACRPERVNRSIIAAVAGEARFIGDVTLTWTSPDHVEATGVFADLDRRFPEDPEVIEQSITWYKAQLEAQSPFDLAQPGRGWTVWAAPRAEDGNKFVGTDTCAECHPSSMAVWKRTGHAYTMNSLQRSGYHQSPECVRCHVIGLGAPDGYVSAEATPRLAAVGCESCHGRGAKHAAAPSKENIVRGHVSACETCHTLKTSPAFDAKTWWERIAHERVDEP